MDKFGVTFNFNETNYIDMEINVNINEDINFDVTLQLSYIYVNEVKNISINSENAIGLDFFDYYTDNIMEPLAKYLNTKLILNNQGNTIVEEIQIHIENYFP